MVRTMRGCPRACSQPGGAGKSETNSSVPHGEEQPYVAEEEVIVDYSLDLNYERSEPEIQEDAQEEKKENYDIE